MLSPQLTKRADELADRFLAATISVKGANVRVVNEVLQDVALRARWNSGFRDEFEQAVFQKSSAKLDSKERERLLGQAASNARANPASRLFTAILREEVGDVSVNALRRAEDLYVTGKAGVYPDELLSVDTLRAAGRATVEHIPEIVAGVAVGLFIVLTAPVTLPIAAAGGLLTAAGVFTLSAGTAYAVGYAYNTMGQLAVDLPHIASQGSDGYVNYQADLNRSHQAGNQAALQAGVGLMMPGLNAAGEILARQTSLPFGQEILKLLPQSVAEGTMNAAQTALHGGDPTDVAIAGAMGFINYPLRGVETTAGGLRLLGSRVRRTIPEGGFVYPDGTAVRPVHFRDGSLAAIKVTAPAGKEVYYLRTARPLSEYSIPPQHFSNLTGQKVLDVGTGDGLAVDQLRRAGVGAEGLDIYLSSSQRAKGYFHQADVAQTGLPDGQYDSILANQTVFTYIAARRGGPDFDYGLRVMTELARITRPGGQVMIGAAKAHDLQDIVDNIPGLSIAAHGTGPGDHWLIIDKR